MSEAFPAKVVYSPAAVPVDAPPADVMRTGVNVRPFTAGVYNMLPVVGNCLAVKAVQRIFSNGSAIDMTVNCASTSQVFSVTPASGSLMISGVGLEVVTSNNIVFNGNAFGGRYYYAGGLLGAGAGYYAPPALSNGLLLQVTSGGVTTQLANLTVNEDFLACQVGISGGSLTGTTDTVRARYEMRQPLLMGTSDQLTWTVRDNMTGNQGIIEIRAYAWGQATS